MTRSAAATSSAAASNVCRRCSVDALSGVPAEQQSYEVGDRPHDVEVLIKDPLQLEAVEHGLEEDGGTLGADALAKPAAGRLVGESVDELALSLMMIPPRACVGMTTWVRYEVREAWAGECAGSAAEEHRRGGTQRAAVTGWDRSLRAPYRPRPPTAYVASATSPASPTSAHTAPQPSVA